MSNIKLTDAQLRVLRAVSEDRVLRRYAMGWFQTGGFTVAGERNANPATMDRLHDLDLIRYARMGSSHSKVIITDKGRALLAAAPSNGRPAS